jgi:hypothetical protein
MGRSLRSIVDMDVFMSVSQSEGVNRGGREVKSLPDGDVVILV